MKTDKKQCSKCREFKHLCMFHIDKSKKLGVFSSCKLCRKSLSQEYWKSNKEKIYKRNRRWVSKNKDWVYDYKKDYVEKNKDLVRKWARDYVKRNKNDVYKRHGIYRENNRDMINKKRRLSVENLADYYIKQRICKGGSLSHKDIPQVLVDAKRQYMKINRITKKG